MPTVEERLASLESKEEHLNQTLNEVRLDVKDIKAGMQKQKGFIAGIMFVVTPIWAAIVIYAKAFWDRFIQ